MKIYTSLFEDIIFINMKLQCLKFILIQLPHFIFIYLFFFSVVYCLIDVHKAKNLHLQSECDNFIAKRIQLYKDANVVSSPHTLFSAFLHF